MPGAHSESWLPLRRGYLGETAYAYDATLHHNDAMNSKIGVAFALTLLPGLCGAQSIASLDALQKGMALVPDRARGEHLYIQYCSVCHKRSGWGSGPREVPALAGQHDVYLLEQLLLFARLERRKPEMHAVVAQPEVAAPQSLRDVSAYIAAQPRNPSSDHGDGTQLSTGSRLYAQSCTLCHGRDGDGNRDDLIPAIGGQQYDYLLLRLEHFAQEHGAAERGSVEPAVINLLAGLSAAQLRAIADYTSRLPALQSRAPESPAGSE